MTATASPLDATAPTGAPRRRCARCHRVADLDAFPEDLTVPLGRGRVCASCPPPSSRVPRVRRLDGRNGHGFVESPARTDLD